MTEAEKESLKVEHSMHGLNQLNAPEDRWRAEIIAKYLVVVEEDGEPRVRVANENGQPKMIGSLLNGLPEHYPVDRLVRELVIKQEPSLRWKWPL
jgi:hypothetical protein